MNQSMNPNPSSYGFILTRHVRCDKTNAYWNTCIVSLRRFYPPSQYKIVIIDDNSNPAFVKPFQSYENVEIIQSEFPGAGELLAFYYFFTRHFFDKVVIIHDSVFFQKKVLFHKVANQPVLPLWHFVEQKNDDINGCLRLASYLQHREKIQDELKNASKMTHMFLNSVNWSGCFGLQCFIDHRFLTHIEQKYKIFRLLKFIKSRPQRCNMERIIGVIFALECPQLSRFPSLLGNIYEYTKWGSTYEEFKLRKIKEMDKKPLIKIWTGR